ncbi:zinc finger protein 184 isoform X1 [Drosophila teissieri]|uniref:zinc finger protein 184 isoform X1 n=1 Tax=Drosophila teissieri TaxID=7243 RepID=UPI001CB9F5BD|nr:zinc finger protein 184 isoform X1 [Drosophila teissieri]
MRCAVPQCRNSSDCRSKRNAGHQQRLGFFRFPKCPDAFKAWLAFCGHTEESLKSKNPCICSEHFNDEDIEGSLKFEMGLAKKRTLRPGAVPCINKSQESRSERAHKERTQRRRNQELVAELLAEEDAKSIPPVAASFEHDNVYISETVEMELDPLSGAEKLEELQKCRTCYRDFAADSTAKDLFDPANSVLLFHIEVISGVWISHKPDEPRFMCPACKLALDQAIDFREMCISTELKINQAKPLTDELQLEAQNEDSISSEHDLVSDSEYTNVDEIEDAGEEHVEVEAVTDDQSSPEPVVESAAPAAQDPLSVALGNKIFKELIDQYTGQERAKLKKATPIARKPRAREQAACEQKPKRSANPKTKEERNLIRRAQLRAKPPNFVCDQCGQAFRMSHNLRIHMLRHSRTKNYQCSECPKTFYDAYMRNMHIRIRHRGETPFGCGFCSETFAYAGARQKHESEVHNAAPRLIVKRINPKPMPKPREDVRYQCKLCHKHYASKYALGWHIKSHTDANAFKCQRCSKSYSDPNKLKRHEMTHEKRPLQCDVCLKGFYQRTRLREHELIHTGERPYWCEVCNVHFRYKYNMKSHANSKMHQDNARKMGLGQIVKTE